MADASASKRRVPAARAGDLDLEGPVATDRRARPAPRSRPGSGDRPGARPRWRGRRGAGVRRVAGGRCRRHRGDRRRWASPGPTGSPGAASARRGSRRASAAARQARRWASATGGRRAAGGDDHGREQDRKDDAPRISSRRRSYRDRGRGPQPRPSGHRRTGRAADRRACRVLGSAEDDQPCMRRRSRRREECPRWSPRPSAISRCSSTARPPRRRRAPGWRSAAPPRAPSSAGFRPAREADVDRAVAAARAAFEDGRWSRRYLPERVAILGPAGGPHRGARRRAGAPRDGPDRARPTSCGATPTSRSRSTTCASSRAPSATSRGRRPTSTRGATPASSGASRWASSGR